MTHELKPELRSKAMRLFVPVVLVLLLSVAVVVFSYEPPVSPEVNTESYSLRKYELVKKFYESIAESSLQLGLKYNVPPAAVMAIAGLESGYGDGYVSRITGNILSLGARKGEPELPPLHLPTHTSSNTVLIDPEKIEVAPPSELVWKKRPPSLKKDYRPAKVAGTEKELAILQKDLKLRDAARSENIKDFVSSWISQKSVVSAFYETRVWLDVIVTNQGEEVLLSCDVAKSFISRIGGKPRSFNHRKSWVEKVNYILDRAGLCQLSEQMAGRMSFEKARGTQSN